MEQETPFNQVIDIDNFLIVEESPLDVRLIYQRSLRSKSKHNIQASLMS